MTSLRALALLVGLLAAPFAARGETLLMATSAARVEITSNFSGTTLTVYGTVERDAATVGRSGLDVAVALVGPDRITVARRKSRIAGIWVNRDSRTYHAPAFYAVAADRPFRELAPPGILKTTQIGFDGLILPEQVPGGVEVLAGTPVFREAFVRLAARSGLYVEYPDAVKWIGSALWTVTLPIPAEVPVGPYRVRALLFSEGVPLAEATATIEVAKTGFESTVADLATRHPILYGLLSVALALVTGWIGGVLFRKD